MHQNLCVIAFNTKAFSVSYSPHRALLDEAQCFGLVVNTEILANKQGSVVSSRDLRTAWNAFDA